MIQRRIGLTLALMCAGTITVRAALDDSKIVAAWTFEEGEGNTVDDASAFGNHGAITGTPRWDNGKFGQALDFDGDDWVIVPHADSLNLNEMTVAAWVYLRGYPEDARIITKEFGIAAPYSVYTLLMSGDAYQHLEFRPVLNNARQRVPSKVVVPLNRWVHVAATYDGAKVTLYIDGEIDTEQAFSGEMLTNEEPVYLGASQFWEPRTYDGLMDDAALFNVALSQGDVQELMTVGLTATLDVEPSHKLAATWGALKR
ncbi:MAG: LamG domain-containing protein [Candidatus Poribacteria bacterium]|nr:LamG domain-containing protein [Candidatus Poribacteria bacterium]